MTTNEAREAATGWRCWLFGHSWRQWYKDQLVTEALTDA